MFSGRIFDIRNIKINVLILLISLTYNLLKHLLLLFSGPAVNESLNYLKIFEAVLLCSVFSYLGLYEWIYLGGLFFIVFYFFIERKKAFLTSFIFIATFAIHIFDLISKRINSFEVIENIIYLISLLFLSIVLYEHKLIRYDEIKFILDERDKLHNNLLSYEKDLEARDRQIEKIEKELDNQKEINKKLSISLGEFYNLQEISKIISQILDTNELIKFVNDVLIGVTGANKSTILLFDNEKSTLLPAVSNLSESEMERSFSYEKIQWLYEKALNCESGYINKANKNEYPFIEERPTRSFMYASIYTKNNSYGVILLEHVFEDVFTEDSLRFLTSIAAQISISLENSSLYQQMRSMAMVDGLTGAYNRIFFFEALEREILLSNGKYPISIAMFDVDNFKKLNDTFGHLFGDKVLQTIVRIAKERVRKDDLVARYGGEEFLILFNYLDSKNALNVVERIRNAIENEVIEDKLVTTKVTVSFGIATYPADAKTPKELIKCADTAMYMAKKSGKNCTKIFSDGVKI